MSVESGGDRGDDSSNKEIEMMEGEEGMEVVNAKMDERMEMGWWDEGVWGRVVMVCIRGGGWGRRRRSI